MSDAVSRFDAGEIVDITIRATVGGIAMGAFDDPCPELHFSYGGPGHYAEAVIDAVLTLTEAVTVNRVTPAEGEPQPGDIWQDGLGREWFVCADPQAGGTKMERANGVRAHWMDVNEDDGPLTLVRRPEPAAKPEPAGEWGDLP